MAAGYVGSEACGRCHRKIYDSYIQTDMGRSMVLVDSAFLERFPSSASMINERTNHHFEVFARDGKLYESEYATSPDGKDIFRNTQQIDFVVGAAANGFGGIVQRGDYLFEAPLSYFTSIKGWDFSPGYEFVDYGFGRPILPACARCHSGRPELAPEGNGHFGRPPFFELAIGCENCHGPGRAHIEEQADISRVPGSIVNPEKLSPWLADNICMPCHQTGDARVLREGKTYADIRPGTPLDNTLSVFMVPFDRGSPPQSDLLEHYLSMRLSKCYRSSGKLSCITCHDPHAEPTSDSAPDYFKQKCLICHTLSSCTLALPKRQATSPPDNCIACHMPKRSVREISHAALTNHRIVTTPSEPFPDEAYNMTTAALPDLVHLSAAPGSDAAPSSLTLLQAYHDIVLSHPEYRASYWALARQLADAYPKNVTVLEALADFSRYEGTDEGTADAIHDLELIRESGAKDSPDYEELATLLIATGQWDEAVKVLRQGLDLIPDDQEMYRMLSNAYLYLGNKDQACALLNRAIQMFPEDEVLRRSLVSCTGPDSTSPQN